MKELLQLDAMKERMIMIEKYKGLQWESMKKMNKLAEEGSGMSLCLGKGSRWGPECGPQTPGRMRSAKERIMGRPNKNRTTRQAVQPEPHGQRAGKYSQRAAALGMRPAHFGRALLLDENPKSIPQRKRRQWRKADLRAAGSVGELNDYALSRGTERSTERCI